MVITNWILVEGGDASVRVWVSGYRSYELGIFGTESTKLKILKKALSDNLVQLLDEGMDWLITGAQLGTEQWAISVAHELQSTYPELQTAVMLPFSDFGKNWNEANQTALALVRSQATFSAAITERPYHSVQQLRQYQQFMLTHTDRALFIYDSQAPGKVQYDIQAIEQWQAQHDYPLRVIDFDELQETANNLAAEQENGLQAD